MTRRFTLDAATDLAARAVRAAGASDEAALSLARATVSANAHGKGSSGFSHLMDYLAALRAGRIVGDAEPFVTSPAPAAIHCDARGGIAQAGFSLGETCPHACLALLRHALDQRGQGARLDVGDRDILPAAGAAAGAAGDGLAARC